MNRPGAAILALLALTLACSVPLPPPPPPSVGVLSPAEDSTVRTKMTEIAARLKVNRDGFDRVTHYTHRNESNISLDGCHIVPRLMHGDGRQHAVLFGVCVYQGHQSILLDDLIVLVGDRRFESNDLAGWVNSVRPHARYRYWEAARVAPRDARLVYEAIGEADDKTTVKVRLHGHDGHKDFTMGPKGRALCRDMWYFYKHFERRPIKDSD